MTTSVLVADDQPLFCSGMQLLIDSCPDLRYVGAAHSGRQAVAAVQRLVPAVVLMDLRMPDGNGVEATRAITTLPRPARVLVLTTFRDRTAVERALQAGATGFITKDATPGALIAAVRDVAAGIPVRPVPGSTEMLGDPVARPAPDVAAIAALTPREQEIFLHAARGLTNAEIGTIAHISENTVRTHISAILAKLRLRGRTDLVAHAHRHALLPLPRV